MSAHDREKGAVGVIINKPLNRTLAEVRPELSDSSLHSIPVYRGGPVNSDELLLAAWKWNVEARSFQLFFGLDPDRLQELLLEHPGLKCKAFLGYSGWGAGQLEQEISKVDWRLSPFRVEFRKIPDNQLWESFVEVLYKDHTDLPNSGNDYLDLGDLPEDPSLN